MFYDHVDFSQRAINSRDTTVRCYPPQKAILMGRPDAFNIQNKKYKGVSRNELDRNLSITPKKLSNFSETLKRNSIVCAKLPSQIRARHLKNKANKVDKGEVEVTPDNAKQMKKSSGNTKIKAPTSWLQRILMRKNFLIRTAIVVGFIAVFFSEIIWNHHQQISQMNACLKNEAFITKTLSVDQLAFLETQDLEIAKMYELKTASGNWRNVGQGVSKIAFENQDLPGMIIKMPKYRYGSRSLWGEYDLKLHHANIEKIRCTATRFNRIVLPESHLYSTPKGLIVVEQKIDFESYSNVSDGPDKQAAMDQFFAFRKAECLCDLNPKLKHNAGFISQTIPPKIGIIDLDCVNYKILDRMGFNNPRNDD